MLGFGYDALVLHPDSAAVGSGSIQGLQDPNARSRDHMPAFMKAPWVAMAGARWIKHQGTLEKHSFNWRT